VRDRKGAAVSRGHPAAGGAWTASRSLPVHDPRRPRPGRAQPLPDRLGRHRGPGSPQPCPAAPPRGQRHQRHGRPPLALGRPQPVLDGWLLSPRRSGLVAHAPPPRPLLARWPDGALAARVPRFALLRRCCGGGRQPLDPRLAGPARRRAHPVGERPSPAARPPHPAAMRPVPGCGVSGPAAARRLPSRHPGRPPPSAGLPRPSPFARPTPPCEKVPPLVDFPTRTGSALRRRSVGPKADFKDGSGSVWRQPRRRVASRRPTCLGPIQPVTSVPPAAGRRKGAASPAGWAFGPPFPRPDRCRSALAAARSPLVRQALQRGAVPGAMTTAVGGAPQCRGGECRRGTRERRRRLAAECHHTARSGTVWGQDTAPPQPASQRVMPDHTANAQPDLLTISKAAELLGAPGRHPPLLAPPGHRPVQLPPRAARPLPPRGRPRLDRHAARPGRHQPALIR
jgi:hypothetical protein